LAGMVWIMSKNTATIKYQRGEVYLVEEHQAQGHEQKKTRPWVLVGATPINRARSTMIAVPLSTQAKEVEGLSIKVYINNRIVCAVLDQIRALDKRRFIQLEGELSTHEMDLIDDGLRQVLSL
jgi:mRNA interferase MazF